MISASLPFQVDQNLKGNPLLFIAAFMEAMILELERGGRKTSNGGLVSCLRPRIISDVDLLMKIDFITSHSSSVGSNEPSTSTNLLKFTPFLTFYI